MPAMYYGKSNSARFLDLSRVIKVEFWREKPLARAAIVFFFQAASAVFGTLQLAPILRSGVRLRCDPAAPERASPDVRPLSG